VVTEQGTMDRIYAMGYSEGEAQRLIAQSLVWHESTESLLRSAGIVTGMRVLDLGSGAGDVSLLVASLVGATGSVVGVERDERSVGLARARAVASGRRNITFLQRDIRDLTFEEPFDAVVGRFILMYLDKPEEILRQLATHLRPGGLLVFQEYQMAYTPFVGYDVPLLADYVSWIHDTIAAAGAEVNMGARLQETFLAAGLPAPYLQSIQILAGRRAGHLVAEIMAETTRNLLPLMERFGIRAAEEIDIDTLEQRFNRLFETGAIWSTQPVVGAWTRIGD
jgi:ubiquinone/menaquinone biosynthesis C-methylase UbiE